MHDFLEVGSGKQTLPTSHRERNSRTDHPASTGSARTGLDCLAVIFPVRPERRETT